MSDHWYNARYYRAIADLSRLGLPYPRKVWWYLPWQWREHRMAQLRAMWVVRSNLKGV